MFDVFKIRTHQHICYLISYIAFADFQKERVIWT